MARDGSLLPPVRAHQWHEASRTDLAALQHVARAREEREGLLLLVAEWDEQPPSLAQLLRERRRHVRRACRDENRVERGVFSPAERAVANQERDVARVGVAQRLARAI